MKIYQFTPVEPKESKAAEKTGGQNKTTGDGSDFASFLKEASSQSPTPSVGPGSLDSIISRENMRALRLPSPTDLGMAGKLLNRLETAIKSASLETLQNVHNLEGLLYIHNKNTPV